MMGACCLHARLIQHLIAAMGSTHMVKAQLPKPASEPD